MPKSDKKKVSQKSARLRFRKRPALEVVEGKTLIGWREYVTLPDWGVKLRAKADTGARSSAIDVFHLKELDDGRVRFEVATDDRRSAKPAVIEADVKRRARVSSSFGDSHERIFVKARIKLAGRTLETEVGLVNREKMRWRILLGRRSLEEQFVVEPGRCYLHGKLRRKTSKGKKKARSKTRKKKAQRKKAS